MTRNILWTGGFDSTWLVVDALLAGHKVHAITWRGYGMDDRTWQKIYNEDLARERIRAGLPIELKQHLTIHEEADTFVSDKRDALIQEFESVAGDDWSPQNQILASLPCLTGRIETGHVWDDESVHHVGVRSIMERNGLKLTIAHLTKQQLWSDAQRRGFDHLLNMTWSCESNLMRGIMQACGVCEPCLKRVIQTP